MLNVASFFSFEIEATRLSLAKGEGRVRVC
jgi:hypothetical protein